MSEQDKIKQVIGSMYRRNLISPKVHFYSEVDDRIRGLVQAGLTKTSAVSKVARETGKSEMTIWRALRAFR